MFPRAVAVAFLILLNAGAVPVTPAAADAPAHRIVSLIPSLTEDLFAVGAGPQVVGVSAYSDAPAAARRLPVISSATAVNAERVVALHPDVVLGIPSQAPMVADLRRAGIRVVLAPDDSFDDLFLDLRTAGALSGHEREARALTARLRARTRTLVASIDPRRRRPSIFVVLGDAPIYTVGDGSYVAQLIALAGGRNASGLRQPYAPYSAEALVARQPDALLVQHDLALTPSLHRAPWSSLRAVRAGRVFIVPDDALLFRPGPRYNDGLAWLITTLRRLPT